MEAGHAGVMAPDNALRTASAFACPGTMQKSLLPDMRVGMVNVSAWVGTESRKGKQPSLKKLHYDLARICFISTVAHFQGL